MNKPQNELEQRLRFSEQKRMHLKAHLAKELSGENTFVWSIVDLMTLLLIFFIFLYSQSTLSPFVPSDENVRMAVPAKPLKRQARHSPETKMAKQWISGDSRKILNALPMDFLKKTEKDEKSGIQKTVGATEQKNQKGALSKLKEEAMAVARGTDHDTLSIRWNEQRLVFVLGERITFPIGKARLLTDSAPLLGKISKVIASKKDFNVVVSGHTDDTPIDTYQYPPNWELSAARAISVARFLCRNGVDSQRLSIQGHAEFRPLHPNTTPENRRANRRVEITLVKQKEKEPERSYEPNRLN